MKKRKRTDSILNGITYLFSSFGVLVLAAIIVFIFSKGASKLSWNMITGDYTPNQYLVNMNSGENYNLGGYTDPKKSGVHFSSVWGVGLSQRTNNANELEVYVSYISENSPLKNMHDSSNSKNYVTIKLNQKIGRIVVSGPGEDLEDPSDDVYLYAFAKNGAKYIVSIMDMATAIDDMTLTEGGGGIRGSIITTIYLIILTLIIALPLGIGAAVYLHEYAKENKITKLMRTMIEMTSGIPSIIFGLVGVIIFIPIMDTVAGTDGGSLISGALTLSIILLPVIIRTTEEALKVIPDSYRQASLALGASKTQTVFKVVIPNAVNGILTSVILSIGRIIGESAALIFVIGTSVKDKILITERSTSLSVHIWALMGGDKNSTDLCCAISIIILLVVFVLSISVKLISKRFNRFEVKA